ncbi:MAG: ankyrin repeat domain-containing protein [Betaproteobacteria bacterium]
MPSSMDPNYQGPFGNTLLHVAAANGDLREVRRLLAAGADPQIRNREGRTPREVASLLRKPKVAALLSGVSSRAPRTPR